VIWIPDVGLVVIENFVREW